MSKLITITVDDAALHAALGRLMASLRDMTPVMNELAGIMQDASDRAFLKEADPVTGTPWTPLARSTQKARQRLGRAPDRNKLQLQGQLVASIGNPQRFGVRGIGPTFALIGTNVAYAAAHQFGATIQRTGGPMQVRLRRKNGRWQFAKNTHKRVRTVDTSRKSHSIHIPARPYLGVGPSDIDAMLKAIARHLSGTIAPQGV